MIDDEPLTLTEWLDSEGRPTSSTDREGTFARRLADALDMDRP